MLKLQTGFFHIISWCSKPDSQICVTASQLWVMCGQISLCACHCLVMLTIPDLIPLQQNGQELVTAWDRRTPTSISRLLCSFVISLPCPSVNWHVGTATIAASSDPSNAKGLIPQCLLVLCHLIRQCTRQSCSHLSLVCLILLKLQGIHTVQQLPKEQTHPQQPEVEKPGWDFVPTPGLGWFYGEFPRHQRVMKIFILGVGGSAGGAGRSFLYTSQL